MSRPKLPEKDTAHFFELETSLHRREIRNSPDAVSALLTDDFLEFGSSGKIWDKPSMVASMEKEQLDLQVTVEDFAARELAPGVVLVTYVSRRGEGNAGDPSAPSTLRSSIWKAFDGKWRMVFHQGTRTSAPSR